MSSEMVTDEGLLGENWLHRELLQIALRKWLKEPEIKVLDFISTMATSKGDNYNSNIYRVAVRCEQRKGTVNIIIKCPVSSGSSGDYIINSTMCEREEQVLSIILPQMFTVLKKVIPDLESFGALFVYAMTGALIMEDLHPGGFRIADRQYGLDLNHCSLVLNTLARYHAASIYLMENKSIDLSLFKKSIFGEPQNKKHMEKFCTGMLRTLSEEVKNYNGLEKYSAKLSTLADKNFLSLQEKALEDHEIGDLLVLSHGDLWVNNIMFRYSSSGELDGIRLVDYQMACITSPCADVQFFLTSSANESVQATYTDQLIEQYHNDLCKTMVSLGCSTQPPTRDKFLKDYNKCTHYSMFAAFNILPMMLVEPGQFDFNNIVATGQPLNVLFRNEFYKRALERLLPMYESKGFL